MANNPTFALEDELRARLPTPVEALSVPGFSRLWLKNDGLTGERYGGNKLRKLAPILRYAAGRGLRRIVTLGAAGSHHVLATTLYGRAQGIEVIALLTPQWHTPHAERVFRCSVGLGAQILPLLSIRQLPNVARQLLGPKTLWLGPGGLGNLGSSGYLDAAAELAKQLQRRELPEPENIVVAVGSGSTAAGLLVGLECAGLGSRLVGVRVTGNPANRPSVITQALALARARGVSAGWRRFSARLEIRDESLGAGYGIESEAGAHATCVAAGCGLELDPTYTAKTFAVALACAAERSGPTLYWHTLSAVPLAPLLLGAPALCDLPGGLRSLLRTSRLGDPPKETEAR